MSAEAGELIDVRVRELDERLEKGSHWLKAEADWLHAAYHEGKDQEPEWERRALRYQRQECKWHALWAEYLAAREELCRSRLTETERLWEAIGEPGPPRPPKLRGAQLVVGSKR